MIYLHPVAGALLLAALLWLALAGLRSRHPAKYARPARVQHRRVGPWLLALFAVEALGGTASVVYLRADLSPAATWHFVAGWTAVGLMACLWGLSRLMGRYPAARTVHRLVGLALVAVAAAVGVLGFSLLP